MHPAYQWCAAETGGAQYMRIKAYMLVHVEAVRLIMFRESTDSVRDLLKELLRGTKNMLEDRVDEVFTAVRRDYLTALGGGAAKFGDVMPKPQRLIRKEILDVIDGREAFFERAFQPEPEDLVDVTENGVKKEDETEKVDGVDGEVECVDGVKELLGSPVATKTEGRLTICSSPPFPDELADGTDNSEGGMGTL